MEVSGLHPAIWLVLILYFAAMLAMGWVARKRIHDQNSYLLGDRAFGVWYMIMHAFGAGTNPGDVTGPASRRVGRGAIHTHTTLLPLQLPKTPAVLFWDEDCDPHDRER